MHYRQNKEKPTHNTNSDSVLGRPEDMAGGGRLVYAGIIVVDVAGDVDALCGSMLTGFTGFIRTVNAGLMSGWIGKINKS